MIIQAFAAVVRAFGVLVEVVKQIDARTGGSGEQEVQLNEAIVALNSVANSLQSEILDQQTPVEPPVAQ